MALPHVSPVCQSLTKVYGFHLLDLFTPSVTHPHGRPLPSSSPQKSASILVSFFLLRAAICSAPYHCAENSLRAPHCPWDGDSRLHSPAQPHITRSPSSLPRLSSLCTPTRHLRTFAQTVPLMGWASATRPLPQTASSLPFHPRDLLIPGKSGICYQAQRASPRPDTARLDDLLFLRSGHEQLLLGRFRIRG